MNIICIDPRQDWRWRQLVEQSPSTVFHSPAWLQVLTETYGFEPCAHVLLDERGEPRAGIPFCRISDIRGERLNALPFSDYCDPLATHKSEWRILADHLLAQHKELTLRCVHSDLPLADPRFVQFNRAHWHGMDLHPDLESLWQGLHSSARRAIRKAEREGVTIRAAENPQDLRSFFNLHLETRKTKYHLLAQPYAFFENIWNNFIVKGAGVLMLAFYHDQVIGGTLFLEWKKTLFYKFNASTVQQLDVRPNDLLIWRGIEYAKAKGFTYLDFGLSDWDQDGLVRYKAKFATEEKTISFLRYTANAALTPQMDEWRKLLSQLTDVFTSASIPHHVTEAAGNLLYRYFI